MHALRTAGVESYFFGLRSSHRLSGSNPQNAVLSGLATTLPQQIARHRRGRLCGHERHRNSSSIASHVDSGLMNPITNLEKVARYLRSIESGDFAYIEDLFSPDAVLEQLPNRIYPNGIKSGVSRMAEAFEKGRQRLSGQS